MVLLFFAVINLGLIKPAFTKLDHQINTENIGRIQAGIEKQIDKVRQINQDWSNWDDMSAYAKGEKPGFYDENLANFGFQEENIGINLCFIFNTKQQIRYSQIWKKELGGELPIEGVLKTFGYWETLLGSSWNKDAVLSGIAVINSTPTLISVSPIRNSSGSGPRSGWLIFGSFLDEGKVKDLIKTTQIPFSIHLLDEKQQDIQPSRLSEQITSPVKDVKGQSILEIIMPTSTTIPDFQKNLIIYLLFAFAFILLFFVFIYAYFSKQSEGKSLNKSESSKRTANLIVLLVILAGLLFSVGIFWYLQKQNTNHLQTKFMEDCEERLSSIQQGENDVIPELQWLRRVFITDESVSKKEFTQFVNPLLQMKPFCSIDWIQKQKDGKYILSYHESLDHKQSPAFSLSFMDQARDSGLVTCSSPFKNNGETAYEVTVYVPIFSSGSPQTIDARRSDLKGFVAGTIKLDSFFRQSISKVAPKGLWVNFYEDVNSQKSLLLYTHTPRVGSMIIDPNPTLKYESTFTVANRKFRVEITPNQEYLQKQTSSYQWIFLLFGLIITLLLAIYLFRTLTQKDQAENLVNIRTKELFESREKFRSTLQSIGDGVIAVDSMGYVTGLNPVAEELTGWSEREASGKPFGDIFNIISASTGKPTENPLSKSLETGKVVYLSNDTTLINRHGQHLQIADSAAPILDTQGKLLGTVMVFHDVSAEYDMKKALIESEERFKAIASNAMDAIILINDQAEIIFWNKATERIFGYSSEEILDKNLHNLIAAPEYLEDANKGFLEFQKSGYGPALDKMLEMKGKRKDGTIFPVELTVSAVTIKDKHHAIGIIRDITDRKRAEEEIKAQNILLHELMGKKDELLSIAAHDIRSPLTVIKGYADLLLMYSKTTLSNDQIEMISKIQGSTKFIIQLLNDLLDFSALESGKVNLDKQEVDIESYMKNYIINTLIVAHQKNMEINSDIQKGLPSISFDPMKIQQVLNNLTSNAIKFSNPGSDILITVKSDQNYISISVKDCGQGIPENELTKLFQPFQKTSVKSTGGEKTTGLGLVIARNIIRAHGGELSVESKVGAGSTFTFTLPILAVEGQSK